MTPAQTSQVSDSLDHLFRHHAGQMVSVLSRIFGVGNIDAIEDSVQDALVAALQKVLQPQITARAKSFSAAVRVDGARNAAQFVTG